MLDFRLDIFSRVTLLNKVLLLHIMN
jgi:hypothetical protein